MAPIDTSWTSNETDRRSFFTRLGGWAMAVGAFVGFSGCDASDASPEDDFGMHGPAQVSDWALKLPEAPSAALLFAPYDDGRPFLRRWAIARLSHGPRNQLVIVLVDTDTGGHAEFEVYARDPAIEPIAASDMYAFTVNNGGEGDRKTPLHMCRLAQRLAEIAGTHEHEVTLDWDLPTLREAVKAEDGRPAPRDEAPEPLTPLLTAL
ncbi:MAG: hypothetical protein QF464_02605 [Myxococcota bacterium]|nr:hypothetical protein [Myxococcota bacterium]